MKILKHPTDTEGHAYMLMRKGQNIHKSMKNAAENWMANKLPDYALPSVTRRVVAGQGYCGIS